MTYKEAANNFANEGDDAWNHHEWNAAAVGYLKAAEMLDHCGPDYATAAFNMRQRSADAQARRDQTPTT